MSPALSAGLGGGSRRTRQVLILTFLLSSAVGASLLILKAAPAPFVWVWFSWAAVFFTAMLAVQGKWLRPILFNLGFVAVVLAAVEAYAFWRYTYIPPTTSGALYVHDEVLGWALAKGTRAQAVEVRPGGLLHAPSGFVFDATYTTDSNGLRVAPPWRKDDLAGTVLFFGCSFTFGEGLQDAETLPYQVGIQSGGRYRTFNFGVGGYSPAQMLTQIEQGMVGRVVDTTPEYAYYTAIPHHVWRAAGRATSIQHEPRYVLDPAGTVHRAGFFEDHAPLATRHALGLRPRLEGQFGKSALWRILMFRDSPIREDDFHLYFAIVGQARALLTARYPGIQFHVILWPGDFNDRQQQYAYERLRDGFRRMGIPLDLVEDTLPGFAANRVRFQLSSADTHPNALADRFLAQQVLNEITLATEIREQQVEAGSGRGRN
jgi:hypothetical protein